MWGIVQALFFLTVLGLVMVAVGAVGGNVTSKGRYDYWDGEWVFSVVVGGVLAFVCGLVLGIGAIVYHSDRNSCASYARATGRPTRFVVLNRNTGSWDCFTPAHDGKLVPTSRVGDFNK